MMKFFKYFEYAYLFIAALSFFEIIRIWDTERDRAYMFAFFLVVAIFMFFFKRRFRRKLEDRNR